ncbi:PTS sugar transporter subunit IIA [Dasania marina]|mgnify:CR=1 FL=1|uniref:PTS sugar transporter subunit IIA n=1 Tax=Dasania marina TaxID=471499 RepID=UPI00037545EB|nr:PTS sugar transporter subunit IIA [Dasania marina]|tara:strand:+ start:30614 stop:31063 length:450 start_codon:yes stop_codon:yes gene_type:complete
MSLSSILTLERTLCGAEGRSKKRVLETTCQFICQDIVSLDSEDLCDKITAREQLGSTGLGHGIAIPHCRIDNCSSITGALIKLEQPVDFDAIDGEPVDILFVLIVPNEAQDEHLAVLATLAKLFSTAEFCQQLRNAKTSQELFDIAINA